MPITHIPVLVEETLQYLVTDLEGLYIDCTLGTGGHLMALANKISPNATLIGFDADPAAIEYCKENIKPQQKTLFINSNFKDLKRTIFESGYTHSNGILFDLGISSFALDNPERGFSYISDGPLDMRISPSSSQNAATFINSASAATLEKVFREYGEEKYSRNVAKAIDRERKKQPINTTHQLVKIINQAIRSSSPEKSLSRIFQSIRIHINHELESLKEALPQAIELLVEGCHLVVISYHSLEDRIVKQFMKRESTNCICPPEFPICKCNHRAAIELNTKSPITPKTEEIRQNPRSRSAKLRAAKKIR